MVEHADTFIDTRIQGVGDDTAAEHVKVDRGHTVLQHDLTGVLLHRGIRRNEIGM